MYNAKDNPNVSANTKQVGGSHYKDKAIQPWDYIVSNNLGYLEGNIVKYVSRWKDKGGVADLNKAMHYLQKLIETQKEQTNAASSTDTPGSITSLPEFIGLLPGDQMDYNPAYHPHNRLYGSTTVYHGTPGPEHSTDGRDGAVDLTKCLK